MRDIELSNYKNEEIINGFEEILDASKNCKFNNCNHINNEGCFVMESLENGQINENRYNNFIKFRDS
jgi:ribosome biogenesis GTPase